MNQIIFNSLGLIALAILVIWITVDYIKKAKKIRRYNNLIRLYGEMRQNLFDLQEPYPARLLQITDRYISDCLKDLS